MDGPPVTWPWLEPKLLVTVAALCILSFSLGFFVGGNSAGFSLLDETSKCASLLGLPDASQDNSLPQNASAPPALFSDTILPILREWGCGHANMEIPRILVPSLGGRMMEGVPFGKNRVMVDVGLGIDAAETLEAVSQGFIAFSFDANMANVQRLCSRVEGDAALKDRFHFVEVTPGSLPDFSKMPEPTSDGKGFAYVYNAGLGEAVGSSALSGGDNLGMLNPAVAGSVPVLTLDVALPPWVKDIYFLKIDTQGYELHILRGATRIMRENQARYILFEYSPRLMTTGNLGNHTELLKLLPSMNYLCFDMIGDHLALPRPSSPISEYQRELLGWHHYAEGKDYFNFAEPIGPWDDIMCANWVSMQADKSPPVPLPSA